VNVEIKTFTPSRNNGDGPRSLPRVRVFDGSGAERFPAEVLVDGTRIARVVPSPATIDAGDAQVIDGAGATLMPGLVEAHAHVSFTHPVELEDIVACRPKRTR